MLGLMQRSVKNYSLYSYNQGQFGLELNYVLETLYYSCSTKNVHHSSV